MASPATVGELTETLRQGGYLADRGLATALFVALSLNRPVLLEGEVGVGKAESAPVVVLTSHRTRELHDPLKRRCLYHWIGYPAAEREVEIVLIREPGVSAALAGKVVAAVHRLRELDLAKPPGVAETIDWARTLDFLGESDLNPGNARDTLGAVVKDRDDLEVVHDNLEEITSGA